MAWLACTAALCTTTGRNPRLLAPALMSAGLAIRTKTTPVFLLGAGVALRFYSARGRIRPSLHAIVGARRRRLRRRNLVPAQPRPHRHAALAVQRRAWRTASRVLRAGGLLPAPAAGSHFGRRWDGYAEALAGGVALLAARSSSSCAAPWVPGSPRRCGGAAGGRRNGLDVAADLRGGAGNRRAAPTRCGSGPSPRSGMCCPPSARRPSRWRSPRAPGASRAPRASWCSPRRSDGTLSRTPGWASRTCRGQGYSSWALRPGCLSWGPPPSCGAPLRRMRRARGRSRGPCWSPSWPSWPASRWPRPPMATSSATAGWSDRPRSAATWPPGSPRGRRSKMATGGSGSPPGR